MAPGVDNVPVNRKQKSLLCKKDELSRGEMKEIILQEKDHRLLLVRNEDDSYCAFGHKCPHYGAPLVDGIMQNGRIRCSRHGACFNSKTGDIEDFPGLDSLPKYQVSIEGDDVVLYSEENDFQIDKRIKPMQTSSCTGRFCLFTIFLALLIFHKNMCKDMPSYKFGGKIHICSHWWSGIRGNSWPLGPLQYSRSWSIRY